MACLYNNETSYVQVGGPDSEGNDVTNEVSYICLEAAHRLHTTVNIGVSVGKNTDPGLLRRGVEILFENRQGIPKFVGMENITDGYARNGIPPEMARQRAYSGCHWFALPGREYCLNDGPKMNLGAVFEVAWNEMMADASVEPSIDDLWQRFVKHLEIAVDLMRDGYDYQVKNEHKVYPGAGAGPALPRRHREGAGCLAGRRPGLYQLWPRRRRPGYRGRFLCRARPARGARAPVHLCSRSRLSSTATGPAPRASRLAWR